MSPYRVSADPIKERLVELDAIINANGKIVSFKTNEPARLRYRIHEAINAARVLGVEPYNSIAITLHVDPPYVHATPRHEIIIQSEVVQDDPLLHTSLADTETFIGAITEFDVVQACRVRPDLAELHFPNFAGKLEPVQAFSQARNYEVTTEPVLILRKVNTSHDSAPSS